jgi:nitroreductase
VEWLVLANRDELRHLETIAVDWMRWVISNQPELALFLGMERMLKRQKSGKNVFLRDAPVVIVAHAGKNNRTASMACPIALTYLELAANSMGLGCCWAGLFNAVATTFPPMIEALSLPKGHQAFGSMMVGYPKFSYHRMPLRKPPGITWRF